MTTQVIDSTQSTQWDPVSPLSWANALGMVYVPMFGHLRENRPLGDHAVLLDGARASLTISADNSDLVLDDAPLSWAWSSNMRHTLVINEQRSTVAIRHWDSRNSISNRPLPRTRLDALELLEDLEKYRSIRAPDVISRMLKAFRLIRSTILPYAPDPTDTVRVFNAFLVGSEYARLGLLDEEAWRRSRTIGEALAQLNDNEYTYVGEVTKNVVLGTILDIFVEPDPMTQYTLEPDLLVRHAAGLLFQEAHFELERSSLEQLSLPGFAQVDKTYGIPKRDARFTPPSLARTIVQQSLDALGDLARYSTLRILDPACGSGVFLQEAIRELNARSFRGRIQIHGYDNSRVSCLITRFCLEQTIQDTATKFAVEFQVEEVDALINAWGKYDLILMNPPFMNWQRMSLEDRESVSTILGSRGSGHVDKAMAFVWKAVSSLNSKGVLGTVVPSPFLDSSGGRQWREAIQAEVSLFLVGRFSGYGYFPGAIVEPAFLVMKGNESQADRDMTKFTKVLLASEGFEDRSLRLLRIGESVTSDDAKVQIREDIASSFTMDNWMPRSKKLSSLLEKLERAQLLKVSTLFHVHQGALTGCNEAFIIGDADLARLPKAERKYFRLVAGSKVISLGQLIPSQYVFYPYGSNGLEIYDEETLSKSLPVYYSKHLLPLKDTLSIRRGRENQWWSLTEARRWQWSTQPKIISKYFGNAGSFAFDPRGVFIVGQGYAWLWKGEESAAPESDIASDDQLQEAGDSNLTAADFWESPLPWAYLALLNSAIFERLLELYCPRVKGGQYNLSVRYVNDIYLPDLSDENIYSSQLIDQLARLGRTIVAGRFVSAEELTPVVAKVYSVPVDEWEL